MKAIIVCLLVLNLLFSFYIFKTRPRIDFLSDDPMDIMTPEKRDRMGASYPQIRIFNNKGIGITKSGNMSIRDSLLAIIEPDYFWNGRITDMETFLINWGFRHDGETPNWNQIDNW